MSKNIKVIFDRKNQAAKTGIGRIDIRIYLKEGERKFETVGSATPEESEAAMQSKSILAKVKHYEQIINAMKLFNEEMTIENFNQHIFQAKSPSSPKEDVLYNGTDLRQSFVEFCREHIEKENLRPNSLKGFKVVFDSLETSGILKTLADLTPANVNAYDAWLHSQNDKTDYTIFGYHKKVHKYTRLLWRLQMISADPYEHVKFNRGSNKERNPLTESELLKLRDAKVKGHQERTRDLFIFMAYTGLAYCDMEVFDFSTMTEERKDYTYIDGSRMKTGSKFFTPILPPAMEVLKKYDYKLPVISNQKLNEYCHVLEALCQINKPVTCHIGRHSFATLMLSYGFSLETVKRMLGHKNITTTQIYAKLSKKVVEDDVTQKLKDLK